MTAKKKTAPRKRAPTSLYVRGFEEDVVAAVKRRAGARGLSHAEYLSRLIQLHARMLVAESPQMSEMLATFGLGKVES